MFLVLLLACTDSAKDSLDSQPQVTDSDSGEQNTDSVGTVSYEQVFPVLNDVCGECHTSAYIGEFIARDDPAGTYTLLMNGSPQGYPDERYVVPGDPSSSVLIQKIGDNPPYGGTMPPDERGSPDLTEEQATLLRTWIAEGAVGPE